MNARLNSVQSLHLIAKNLIDQLKEVLTLFLLFLQQSFEMFGQRLNAKQLVILAIILMLTHQTLQSSTR